MKQIKKGILYSLRVDIAEAEALLAAPADENTDRNHARAVVILRERLAFYRHERLIHLLVTLSVALAVVILISFAAVADYSRALPLYGAGLLLMCLLVGYLRHYFFLENGVQRLSELSLEIVKIANRTQ